MPKYAGNTEVSCAKSRVEIEQTLIRYGADSFAYATSDGMAMIAFRMRGRQARLVIPLPKLVDYAKTETGRERAESSQYSAWEQACHHL